MQQILEGSRAIALTINNIKPAVISAYPITPQTHIVEDLAKFKADGKADYEYVRAESEFAAASIVEGASATGVRVYTATCSQGLLLMTEVLFNIAGMRLPVVVTCANRGVSAPITIWNDQQDVMTIRDAGWIIMFAENHQEAVNQHIMAYKIAEKLNLPVMVNIDGYILTHSYEPVIIPTRKQIKKYLPDYNPKKGQYLDPANPVTFGAFARPQYYMEIREDLQNDLISSLDLINKEYENYHKVINTEKKGAKPLRFSKGNRSGLAPSVSNGLIEYYGPKKAKTILVAMGSVVGTVKEVVDEINSPLMTRRGAGPPSVALARGGGEVGVLKVKTYRPFPSDAITNIIKKAKYVAVMDKSISLGHTGPLANDIKTAAQTAGLKNKINSYIVGLGGRDITRDMIKKIIADVKKGDSITKFIGK